MGDTGAWHDGCVHSAGEAVGRASGDITLEELREHRLLLEGVAHDAAKEGLHVCKVSATTRCR